VLHADHSGHRAGPSAVAVGIEEVGVGELQVALGAGAGGGQGPAAAGTAEQKDVSEFLSCQHGGPSTARNQPQGLSGMVQASRRARKARGSTTMLGCKAVFAAGYPPDSGKGAMCGRGIGKVPRLRRSAVVCGDRPSPAGWAKLCRASGADWATRCGGRWRMRGPVAEEWWPQRRSLLQRVRRDGSAAVFLSIPAGESALWLCRWGFDKCFTTWWGGFW